MSENTVGLHELSDDALARAISNDRVIRQACEALVVMILSQRRMKRDRGRYSVAIQGRQIVATFEVSYGTVLLPPEGCA